ncbi:hypothetical protein AKJ09_07176 [Labilithrix luteola]|uniref:Diphthamide synthase domain-containing protein n=1 Tax=Labilithrix luteola TaxID=1391654 RepID=A0A0K1Q437_9BACT|nr:adenine nucleotide alpha hydrolase [Labilithrix luteola]AKV00513.1 hypothetical protein AKJ09_07176 [Labilithrix luteola]
MRNVSSHRSRALLSWSSGKDSAWALRELRRRNDVDVVGLLTTVDEEGRVAAHRVPRALVEAQARAIGLPLRTIELPRSPSNATYEAAMREAFAHYRDEGIAHVVFGDLHLQDVRAYRERLFDGTGVSPFFPLWGRATDALAREMIDGGLRAVLVALDAQRIASELIGHTFDDELLRALPTSCDPCGEDGEFHTFVFDGPMFKEPIGVTMASVVREGDFVIAELRA